MPSSFASWMPFELVSADTAVADLHGPRSGRATTSPSPLELPKVLRWRKRLVHGRLGTRGAGRADAELKNVYHPPVNDELGSFPVRCDREESRHLGQSASNHVLRDRVSSYPRNRTRRSGPWPLPAPLDVTPPDAADSIVRPDRKGAARPECRPRRSPSIQCHPLRWGRPSNNRRGRRSGRECQQYVAALPLRVYWYRLRIARRAVAVALDQPVFVVGPPEVDQGEAEFFDGA